MRNRKEMRAGAKVGSLGPALSSDLWHPSVLKMNALPSFPFHVLAIFSLLTPVLLTAPELGVPGIQKKKRFCIEDEDESD